MAAARAVLSVLWLLVCGMYADEISQGLDQDVCHTPDCAVKLLQVASRTPEGHALTEESEKKSNAESTSDSGGSCQGKASINLYLSECQGLSAYSCLHNSRCDWNRGFGPGPCKAKTNDLPKITECSGYGQMPCQNMGCVWDGSGASGGGGGGYGNTGKCQAKGFNIFGMMECGGLSKWSCIQNSNCEFVIG